MRFYDKTSFYIMKLNVIAILQQQFLIFFLSEADTINL